MDTSFQNAEPKFSEEGVSELWRAAPARRHITIDAEPMGWGRRYVHNVKTAEFSTIFAAIFILWALPWGILIGGILCLALWDLITSAH